MNLFVRRTTFALAAVLVALCANSVSAATYPTKPVTLIVPQAPGGTNDIVARLVAQKLSESLGQQFIVENRPGAGGNIGTQAAARAPRDGYTLLATISSAQAINPALYKTVPFDPIRDFDPIAPIASVPNVLVAHPSFPAKSMKELIDLVKSQPGKVQFASAGNGTLNHLLGELLNSMAGIELQHIPYKGFAPAGTPKDIIAKLNAEIVRALDTKDLRDKLAGQGAEIVTGTPEQLAAMLKEDVARWARIVKASGATVD